MPNTIKFSVKQVQELFGRLPGQSLTDFAAELKSLTEQDRIDLANGMSDGTLSY